MIGYLNIPRGFQPFRKGAEFGICQRCPEILGDFRKGMILSWSGWLCHEMSEMSRPQGTMCMIHLYINGKGPRRGLIKPGSQE